MAPLAIFLLLSAAAVTAFLLFGRREGRPRTTSDRTKAVPSAASPASQRPHRDPAQSGAAQARAVLAAAQTPEAVSSLALVEHASLPAPVIEALMSRLSRVPRPPGTLFPMLSSGFLDRASSSELADLMMDEPRIVAKVLATVNSALYGLPTPIENLGQAVTYLGMNTVRAVCMRLMLESSFRVAEPRLRKIFEQQWSGNALANELCFKLAYLLRLPEPGALGTQVTLSHLGQFAALTLLEPDDAVGLAALDAVERTRGEQERLGLCAAELGSLMMTAWEVPPSIIADARDVERILVTPYDPLDPSGAENGARAALCYLCNRLGEAVSRGEIADIRDFDLASAEGAEYHCLRTWLDHPRLQRLPNFLKFPDVVAAVDRTVATEQSRLATH